MGKWPLEWCVFVFVCQLWFVFVFLLLWQVLLLCVCSVWLCNKSAKLFTLNSTRWYATAFALRQRMLNFVQNLQYYMMFEVIEPNWQLFESNMDTVCTRLMAVSVQLCVMNENPYVNEQKINQPHLHLMTSAAIA